MSSQPHSTAGNAVPVLRPGQGTRRRLLFTFVFLVAACAGNLLFADYLWRSQLYGLKYVLLGLFVILFTYLSFSFATSLFGFFCRVRGTWADGSIDASDIEIPSELPPTAILFPIYNEDVQRVMAGVRATWKSLEATGLRKHFDFFILSDSRDPDKWVEEEVAWLATCRELGATGRMHYRHRRKNTNKKAGNISEFLSRWGKGYRYMVIFDADSMMTGDCLVKLAALMEKHPQAGIIQTVPKVVRAETVYGRSQQFASALYGPVFAAGLNYWQQGEGNYWGHNAIIRVAPFIEHCELPDLPWREPLGGKILSHDFVEAALIRRAGHEVWLAHNLEGSYEESPPSAVEAAERDRRWCQGNLQHSWLLFAGGFTWVNRVHLLNGILSYANAFFWFWFLLISTLIVVQFEVSELSLIATPGFFGLYDISLMTHGLIIMGLTALMLFAPKIFAVLDLLRHRKRRKKFGGFWKASLGAVLETLYSAFLAPANMLWHATFVVTIPMGKSVSWNAQNRSAGEGLRFLDAIKVFWWMTLLGIAWSILAWTYGKTFFGWIMPVLAPLILSIPFAQLSSSAMNGAAMRSKGWWNSPEENEEPPILQSLKEEEAQLEKIMRSDRSYREQALVDPYVNALHATLEKHDEVTLEDWSAIREKIASGDNALTRLSKDEWLELLTSAPAVKEAHMLLWTGDNHLGIEEKRSPLTPA